MTTITPTNGGTIDYTGSGTDNTPAGRGVFIIPTGGQVTVRNVAYNADPGVGLSVSTSTAGVNPLLVFAAPSRISALGSSSSGVVRVVATGAATPAGVDFVGSGHIFNGPAGLILQATGDATLTGSATFGFAGPTAYDGIAVTSTAAGGSARITTASGITGFARGIFAGVNTGGAGVVEVTTTGGSITAQNFGIYTSSGAGATTIVSGGAISTTGSNAYGIYAQANGGAVSITTSGTIDTNIGLVGLYTNGGSNATSVTVGGAIGATNRPQFGVYLAGSSTQTASLTANAAINGTRTGVASDRALDLHVSANVAITGDGIGVNVRGGVIVNAGKILSDSSAVSNIGDAPLTINNYSVIDSNNVSVSGSGGVETVNLYAGSTTGYLSLGDGADVVSLYTGAVRPTAITDPVTGRVLQAAGTYGRASFTTIDFGAGANMLELRGAGDGGANGALALAALDSFSGADLTITNLDSGTWRFSTTSTASRPINIAAGVLDGVGTNPLGVGTITFTGPGTLRLVGAAIVNPIVLGAAAAQDGVISADSIAGTVNGAISGAGRLIKQGDSSLTLTGTNTYTGATQVESGALVVNGAVSSSSVTVASGAQLLGTGTISQSVSVQSGGVFAPGSTSGTGILTAGALSLASGATFKSTVAGPASANYGHVTVSGAVSLAGSLALTFTGSTAVGDVLLLIDNTGAGALSGAFSNVAQGEILDAGAHKYRVSYTGGDGNDVTLTDVTNSPPVANTDSATVTIDSGPTVIDVLGNDTDPDAGQTLSVTGVTQPATGGSVTFTSGGVSFTPTTGFRGATSFTYTVDDGAGGTATGTVNISVAPTHLFTFNTTGTYASPIPLDATSVNDVTTLQTTAANVTETITGALTQTGTGLANQPVVIDGPGRIILTNTGNSWTGVTTINAGSTLQGASNSISGSNVVDNGALVFNQATSGTFGLAISGTGSLSVGLIPAGQALTFSGALTQTGGFTVADASNVTIAQGGSYAAPLRMSTNGGAFTNLGAVQVIGSGGPADLYDAVRVNAGGVVTNGSAAVTSATIRGSSTAVIAVGAPATTVNNYGLLVGENYASVGQANAGAITVNNLNGTAAGTGGVIYGRGLLSNGWGVFNTTGGALTVTNQSAAKIVGATYGVYATGASTSVTNSGLIAAGSYNSATGAVTVGGADGVRLDAGGSVTNLAGGTITSASDAVLATGVATIVNAGAITATANSGVTGFSGGVLTVTNAVGGTITGGSSGAYGYGVQQSSGSATVNNYGAMTGSQGGILAVVSGAVTANLYAGSTTGNVVLSGGNDTISLYTGTGTANAGVVANGITLQAAGPLAPASFSLLSFSSGNDTLNLRGAGDGSSANGAAGAISLTSLSSVEAINKLDAGTWRFTTASSATTPITVQDGRIDAAVAGAFGTGAIVAQDAVIEFSGLGIYANALQLEEADPATDPTLLVTDAGVTATLSGAITRTGGAVAQGLRIGGGGVVSLTNISNAWTGATTIDAGATLRGAANTISGTSVVDDGVLNFDQSGAGAFTAPISGAGAVTKTNAGTLILTGLSTYTGGTTISAGAIEAQKATALGTGAVIDNATLNFRTTAGTVANAVGGTGSLNVSTVPGGQTLTFAGALTQTGGFTVVDASNVTIAQGGSYTAGLGVVLNGGVFTNLGVVDTRAGGSGNQSAYEGLRPAGGGVINNGSATVTSATIQSTGSGIVVRSSAPTTINNYGLVSSAGFSGVGQFEVAGALTVNNRNGATAGTGGVIYGGGSWGVFNAAGSALTVTNESAAKIVGGVFGVYATGAETSVTNAGRIASGALSGSAITPGGTAAILIAAGGAVTNLAGGAISGGSEGITGGGAAALVVDNTGAISTTGSGPLVSVSSGSTGALTIVNRAGGAMSGRAGVFSYAGAMTVLNAGSVLVADDAAVARSSTDTALSVINAAGGLLRGGAGIYGQAVQLNSTSSTLDNYGALATLGTNAVSSVNGANAVTLRAGSTTQGSIVLGSGADTVNLHTGAVTTAADTTTDPITGAAFTLRAAGTYAAATFGAINAGAGADVLSLRGAGDGTGANGAAGAVNFATVTGFETLSKQDGGTWTLSGVAGGLTGVTFSGGTLQLASAAVLGSARVDFTGASALTLRVLNQSVGGSLATPLAGVDLGDRLIVDGVGVAYSSQVTGAGLVLRSAAGSVLYSFTFAAGESFAGESFRLTDDGAGNTVATVVANASGPVFGSGTTASVMENTPAATIVYTAAASDAQSDYVTYSITGGADASRFTIDAVSGAVRFVASPDREAPTDAGPNNVYDVVITASDGTAANNTTRAVAITVTDVNDSAPVLNAVTNPGAVVEAADASAQAISAAVSLSVSDADTTGTLSASAAAGTAKLNGATPAAGTVPAGLLAASALSFGTAASNGGAATLAGTYAPGAANLDFLRAGDVLTITFAVAVSDGVATSTSRDVTVTITGTNDAPTGVAVVSGGLSIAENSANGVQLATLAGIDADDATFLALRDSAGGRFALDGDGRLTVADGTRLDYETATSHAVVVRITDASGAFVDRTLTVQVTDVADEAVVGTPGADTLNGGAGADVISGLQGPDVIFGGAGNDVLYGNQDADVLNGGADNDVLYGGQGDDQLFGADGNDLLQGGLGDDVLSGDGGIDTASYFGATAGVTVSLLLQGQAQATGVLGNDTLSGIENLVGSDFADVLTGDAGDNALSGGDGADLLTGGLGRDTLVGGGGDDVLYGNQDIDVLSGGDGADVLYGGQGDDALDGGAGADVLQGGGGADTLTGGTGADVFRYVLAADSAPGLSDLIGDFASGEDKLDLRSLHTGGASDSFVIASSGGQTTVDVFLAGHTTADLHITLTGTNALTSADVLWG